MTVKDVGGVGHTTLATALSANNIAGMTFRAI